MNINLPLPSQPSIPLFNASFSVVSRQQPRRKAKQIPTHPPTHIDTNTNKTHKHTRQHNEASQPPPGRATQHWSIEHTYLKFRFLKEKCTSTMPVVLTRVLRMSCSVGWYSLAPKRSRSSRKLQRTRMWCKWKRGRKKLLNTFRDLCVDYEYIYHEMRENCVTEKKEETGSIQYVFPTECVNLRYIFDGFHTFRAVLY